MDYKGIRDFAIKWKRKFQRRGEKAALLVDDPKFPVECKKFGFEIDMGEHLRHVCKEEYVGSFEWMSEHAQEIKVSDIRGLGSAIFSKWRYYNGYAYSSDELDEPGCREWFSLAFKRLEELANSVIKANEEAAKEFED